MFLNGAPICWSSDLESMVKMLPCAAAVERGGNIVAWNDVALQMRGVGDAEQEPAAVERVFLGAYPFEKEGGSGSSAAMHFDCAMLRADGRMIPVRGALREFMTESGPARLLTLAEHGHAENKAVGQGTFVGELLDAAPEAVAITQGGRVLYVNREFTSLFGYTPGECLGVMLDELITPAAQRGQVDEVYRQVERSGRVSVDTVRTARGGDEIDVSLLVGPIGLTESTSGLFHTFRDIRKQKKTEALLQYRAMHDSLTGLANRALFVDRVQVALKRLRREPSRHFAVLFLDLDGFKAVNDTLGHHAGDELLLAVSRSLRDCVRPQDTLARFGGDEFALLLEEVESIEQVQQVAERLLEAIHATEGPEQMRVSASLGITVAKSESAAAARVLREADIAMYQAKAAGKACSVIYRAGMTMPRRTIRGAAREGVRSAA
jgi:Amt family ammonium transporter